MTHLETAESPVFTKDQAYNEVVTRSADWSEFIEDFGDREQYDASGR